MVDTRHCYLCGKVNLWLMKRILVDKKKGRKVSSRTVYICQECRRNEG